MAIPRTLRKIDAPRTMEESDDTLKRAPFKNTTLRSIPDGSGPGTPGFSHQTCWKFGTLRGAGEVACRGDPTGAPAFVAQSGFHLCRRSWRDARRCQRLSSGSHAGDGA